MLKHDGLSWAEYAIVGFLVIGLGFCGLIFWNANRPADPKGSQSQLTPGKMAKQVAKLQAQYRTQRSRTVETSGNSG